MSVTKERAAEILEYVLEEFIPGYYEMTWDEKKQQFSVENSEVNLRHSWVITEPKLSEVLLYLDAHSFCALIIRNTESADSSRRLPADARSRIRNSRTRM